MYDQEKIDKEQTEETEKWSVSKSIIFFGECGYKCIKYTFFSFNLLFCVVGSIILVIGVLLHSQRDEAAKDYAHEAGNINYVNGPAFCIAIGTITILISFLACCGAKTNNICMLGCYCGLLALIFCLEIVAITITYVYKERIETTLKNDFKRTLNQYGHPRFDLLSKSIDALQRDFHCCGNKNYTDWFSTAWGDNNTDSVPLSCCKGRRDENCNKNLSTNSDRIYKEGCYNHVKKYLLENLHIISGFGVWIAAVELLGIVFSVILICKVRKEENEYV